MGCHAPEALWPAQKEQVGKPSRGYQGETNSQPQVELEKNGEKPCPCACAGQKMGQDEK